MSDRGSALIEVVVGGGLTVALIAGLVVGSARLQHASERAYEAATVAATVATSEGSEAGETAGSRLLPESTVMVSLDGAGATARVSLVVRVVGFGGLSVSHTVTATATEPLSPFRSRR